MPTSLVYSSRFFPSYVGGGERLAQLTARGLRANGVPVSLVTTGSAPAEYEYEGTTVHVVADAPAQLEDALGRMIASLAPSFVHMVGAWGARAAGVAARRAGVPFGVAGLDYGQICDNHRLVRGNGRICPGPRSAADCFRCGLERERPRDRWLGRLGHVLPASMGSAAGQVGSALLGRPFGQQLTWGREFTSRAAARQQAAECLDVFVAPTRFTADLIRTSLPARTRCEQLMYPVADDLLRPEVKRTPADRLVVGFAGRALRMKGLHVLLDAAASVAGKVPLDLRIEAATNDGEERGYWQPLKDRAAALENVQWSERGVLESEALRAFHAQIDVLAVPSLWPEYVGFVALEAMALGTPVVLSDFASQRELLTGEGNGDVVPAGDAGALGAGLERCWRRKRAGVRPAPVTPAHPATEYGRRLVAIYEDVLA